jgi:hypothetical protein
MVSGMRSLAIALLLALSGCYYYPYAPPVPPPPPAAAAPAAPPQAQQAYISEDQAVGEAFRLAQQRGLHVDQVHNAHLDGSGRWHVDLQGHGDRARLLLDARDGRLLKGKFRAAEEDFVD